MSSVDTLESIKISVRSARQHAYLGFYEESIKSFNKALDIIRRHYKSLDDKILINEWKTTEKDLFDEMTIVNDLKNIVQGLKNEPGKNPISGANSISEPKKYQENLQAFDNDIGSQQAKRYPFDQKPFSHQSKHQENDDEESKGGVSEKPHYIYVSKPQTKGHPSKDPDVWDNPSPKHDISKNKPMPQPKRIDQKKLKPTTNPQESNNRRNYDKPWKVPQKPIQSNEDKNKEACSDKKSFLYHCYPDGKGPDAELIQMLEKDVVDQNPNVRFEDIASLEGAKQILQEAVLLPLLCPELFIGIRRPWSGVLMFGPPGTGKTLLAKAVATQGKTTFFNITASSLASKWRGESERLVRILFEIARFYAPTTIFFDEIDALGSKRGGSGEHETSRRVLSELLIQMDGMNSVNSANANEQANDEQKKTLTVIGATNRPWDLDEALRRRLEKRIYIPLPNEHGREELFKINLKGIKLADSVNFENLVKQTAGYSGADIASVCREASMMPIRKKLLEGGGILNQLNDIEKLKSEMDVPITQEDFLTALKNVHKSVSNTDLNNYVKWMAEFGSS